MVAYLVESESLIWSDISSILLKQQYYLPGEKMFESIVLKIGTCLITHDALIICQINLYETNGLL